MPPPPLNIIHFHSPPPLPPVIELAFQIYTIYRSQAAQPRKRQYRLVQGACLKKNAMEIQQAVVHHKRGYTIKFLHKTKEQLFSFSMILFLNRNDEKWPHTRQIKIAGRNHILPPLGIAWKTNHRQFPRGN